MTISFFVCQKLYKTRIQSKNQKGFQFNTEIVSGFVLCLDIDTGTEPTCIARQQGCTISQKLYSLRSQIVPWWRRRRELSKVLEE